MSKHSQSKRLITKWSCATQHLSRHIFLPIFFFLLILRDGVCMHIRKRVDYGSGSRGFVKIQPVHRNLLDGYVICIGIIVIPSLA